ncbi:hypothetical protein HOLleu_44234 [Holothuria leucospilota]|uniref:Uncharacterized protein n=1 Tax=Holothuria leucospilota TaxID=206669 RepID=A0A9Q0Y8Y5_HOLLE|nr:hypothetical protein HOLleu_44234 [Holothuria leucospilota]
MTPGKPAAIIQWNCRGLRPNDEEIKCFVADWSPLVMCLQETFLRDTDNLSFKGNYLNARAKARRIIKSSKRESWKQYISKLNSNTPVKKAWDMVRKSSGKQISSSVLHVSKPDGSKCTETAYVANLLADEFESNSSSNHYSQAFQKFLYTAEKQKVNFTSDNSEDYNSLFNITELRIALERSNDTATGPDEVHYQFLKHLPDNSLLVLLDIFNGIWKNGCLTGSHHHSHR